MKRFGITMTNHAFVSFDTYKERKANKGHSMGKCFKEMSEKFKPHDNSNLYLEILSLYSCSDIVQLGQRVNESGLAI